MRNVYFGMILTLAIALSTFTGMAQSAGEVGPYRVLKSVKAGTDGGFDYISADVENRRLYVPRSGAMGHLMIFDLDTLESAGGIDAIKAGGAVVDPKSGHGFSTTRPISMWDAKTLQVLKTIDVGGRPDGIMFDPFNQHVWVLSHTPPYATVIDAKDGVVVGTVDLVGTAEQAVSDGRGTVYINVSDKGGVAVVDARSLKVKANYDMSAKGVHGSGMSVDAKNHVLFAYYRDPKPVVTILNAETGALLAAFPTGEGVDTVAFNPATMEAISAANDGAMTFIKENSPTNFTVEQTLQLMPGTKTMALDSKTNHIFTMAAEYAPAPANAQPGPAGRPPRGPMVPGSFTVLMVGRK
jgi:DNA-binding beta-propeller fold protein YncE